MAQDEERGGEVRLAVFLGRVLRPDASWNWAWSIAPSPARSQLRASHLAWRELLCIILSIRRTINNRP